MSSQTWQSILQNCAVANVQSREVEDCADDEMNNSQWMENLSTKRNIFYGAPPYMPILVENIPEYVKLVDFEFDRIKEIQTIGIVFGEGWLQATLYDSNLDNSISIPLNFECLKRTSLSKLGYRLETKLPFKIFGRLINLEEKPLLEVHHLMATEDLEESLKTLTMLSKIVRQKYHYYVCSPDPQ